MRIIGLILLLALLALSTPAQTIEDGIMMGRNNVCTGYLYSFDSWNEYWEGTRKRDNGNIGTLTTQSHTYFANYGLTSRVNLITMLPHVSTNASQGVLAPMRGMQDATFAAKFRLFQLPFTSKGNLRGIAVVTGAVPMSDYTPDFLPLSIGLASRRISARGTLNFQARSGWFINATGAHTWRGAVGLDRPFYYTSGKLTFSDQVTMPSVFDYTVSAGYTKGELFLAGMFAQQRTLGGGDIRRQDMPFVSNRMNFSRPGVWVKVPVLHPGKTTISVVGGVSYVADGRNVGQSVTVTGGVMYLFKTPWSLF